MSEAAPAASARPARNLPVPARVVLLALGAVALAIGALAGLARLGVPVPDVAAGQAALHGPLMTGGFLGTVIALERAVALGRAWAYAAPLLAGLATLAMLARLPQAPWLLVASSVVLLAATADVFRRQRALFTFALAIAVVAWLAGNVLWALGRPVHEAAWWWLAFLVLTIAAERLELSRFLPPSPVAQRVFVLILCAIALALAASLATPMAVRALGLAWLALAAWLVRQDIARRTIRATGLTRYVAACLLSGYVWLAAAGFAMVAGDVAPGGGARDAALHALALGFVFSMVFGHGPIIVPAVLRVSLPYHPAFYAPLAALHGSLLLRVVGDATGASAWSRAGAIGNAAAIALFIVSMLAAVVRGRRATSRATAA
ncbi:MAG TPA: hypothetical protein VFX05_09800 [Casimicrobiaceae bacterium]|nr:hypothetical protein [Casimicrobiaceae bacterium]